MPSGLFLRIFLWFWLAMTVVGVTFVLAVQLTRPARGFPRWREFAGNTVSLHVQRSVEALKSGGRPALRDYLDEVESDTGMRPAVFDSQGQPMVGRMPPNAQDLATRSRQSGRVEYQPAGGGGFW